MFATCKTLVLSIGLVAGLAPLAAADGFGISFAKHGNHTAFGLEIGIGGFFSPAPPPVHCNAETWVPGHYEIVLENVWVEGATQPVWCAPAYEWRRDACGRWFKVMVAPGHWTNVGAAGHNETRRVEVWRPAHWEIAEAHAH